MAASDQMTEYERKRLENIKRNSQVLASLKIHSHVADLSATSKRFREEKSYKQSSEKKPKPDSSPVVIRRSLRTRGKPPDLSGLSEGSIDSPAKPSRLSRSPESNFVPVEAPSMEQAYEGKGSPLALVKKLTRLTRKIKSENEDDHSQCARKIKSEDGDDHSQSARKIKFEDGDDHSQSARKIKLEYEDDYSQSATKFERVKLEEPFAPLSLKLEYDNIARVVPGRIFSVQFFPTTEMTMVVVGNKFGQLGFWDVKPQMGEEKDVIHLYKPHLAPISGISVHPFALSKVYSSCYDGFLRMMNIEREKFELVCSSADGSSYYSLAQQPQDVNTVYFAEGPGGLNMFDVRVGEISSSWPLHQGRINSIDFSPSNTNFMATSSTDGFACLWDLRNMKVKIEDKHPDHKAMWTVKHTRAVHSAYFSPSGRCLATTSVDDNIGVLTGVNFEDTYMIPHDNWTNRWISSFRAVWGWDDTHLYIGNMKRRVDVLSVTQKKTVHSLASSHMSAIPCRYHAHPCNVGMLAGATSGGQVYIWTASS
uniref:WD repeat-containing protein 76 n=2 Tax=Chenopodium quinoa TaxID=63459 RepID=A0A803KPE5_CHEQI